MFVPLDVCDLGATWRSFRLRGKLDFFLEIKKKTIPALPRSLVQSAQEAQLGRD